MFRKALELQAIQWYFLLKLYEGCIAVRIQFTVMTQFGIEVAIKGNVYFKQDTACLKNIEQIIKQ